MSPPSDLRRMPPQGMRDPSPYDEPYTGGRPPPRAHFSPGPPKKPLRKEPHGYDRGHVPPPRPGVAMHMDTRMPHRGGNDMSPRSPPRAVHPRNSVKMKPFRSTDPDDRFETQGRGRGGPLPGLSKRPPPSKPYDSPPASGYRSPSPAYSEEKRYAPTLHERFSGVADGGRTEPRIKYTREDLEKITIDIHRNIKELSPTRRHIVDPNDVKLVRRANEGHRPMFDRDEIKQSARDMREDVYYEKKVSVPPPSYPMHSSNLRDDENYEITRDRFDPHAQSLGRSLNDRWQSTDGRKESMAMDQDDRDMHFSRPGKRATPDDRSKSGDRDFRSERYPADTSRSRSDFSLRMHSPPPESRGPPLHRKDGMDIRRKVSGPKLDKGPPARRSRSRSRSRSRGRYPPPSDKHYSDAFLRNERSHGGHRSPGPDPYKWPPRKSTFTRDDEFSRRPEKYYKPEGPPTSSNYYKGPDRRSPDTSYRGRGGTRPYRTRGMRGRGFRGSTRGTYSPRGSSMRGGFRGYSTARGRGAPRRGRMSPGFWEHDLYSPDEHRKMDHP